MFQTVWAEVGGKKKDILAGGELACASFVSGVLLWSGLIKEKHATVTGTLKDMRRSGWKKIKKPREGCILRWEKREENGGHEHLGFYMGTTIAISNSKTAKVPVEHHWTYRGTRKIVAMYWHPRLNK